MGNSLSDKGGTNGGKKNDTTKEVSQIWVGTDRVQGMQYHYYIYIYIYMYIFHDDYTYEKLYCVYHHLMHYPIRDLAKFEI